jgi:hypothetical protein
MPAQTISFRKDGSLLLWSQITARNAVIAVKLDIIEGCGDAMPAGHSSGLRTTDMRHGSNDYVSEAQGFAYQDDLKFDRGACHQLPGAKKIDAG